MDHLNDELMMLCLKRLVVMLIKNTRDNNIKRTGLECYITTYIDFWNEVKFWFCREKWR